MLKTRPGTKRKQIRAPATRFLGVALMVAGVIAVLLPGERWKSPFFILAGILVLVFARYVRYWMVPDCWFVDEDER